MLSGGLGRPFRERKMPCDRHILEGFRWIPVLEQAVDADAGGFWRASSRGL
jgi:hypothetical protein